MPTDTDEESPSREAGASDEGSPGDDTSPEDEIREGDGESSGEDARSHLPRFVDVRWTVAGGLFAAIVLFLVGSAVGLVSQHEARHLLEATLPTIRFLASGVLAAGATILALMLTLISLTEATELDFKPSHYRRLELISLMNAVAIIVSVVVLVFLSVPLGESDGPLRDYYHVVYYLIMVGASLLGGIMVAIVLMLHNAVRGLVTAMAPRGSSPLVHDEE